MSNDESDIKKAAHKFYEQNAIDDGRFVQAMAAEGWQGIDDLFGTTGFWQHLRTDRIIPHAKAYDYYQLTKATPNPFCNVQ